MKVGVTGSRVGMSGKQTLSVRAVLRLMHPDSLHHGDCVGADDEIATFVEDWCWTTAYPADVGPDKRAFHPSDFKHEPKPPLVRNHDIVDAVDVLIVLPKERIEHVRSGTWATYRYAKRANVPRLVIYPEGDMIYEAP